MTQKRRETIAEMRDYLRSAVRILNQVKEEEYTAFSHLSDGAQMGERGTQMEYNIDTIEELICDIEDHIELSYEIR